MQTQKTGVTPLRATPAFCVCKGKGKKERGSGGGVGIADGTKTGETDCRASVAALARNDVFGEAGC